MSCFLYSVLIALPVFTAYLCFRNVFISFWHSKKLQIVLTQNTRSEWGRQKKGRKGGRKGGRKCGRKTGSKSWGEAERKQSLQLVWIDLAQSPLTCEMSCCTWKSCLYILPNCLASHTQGRCLLDMGICPKVDGPGPWLLPLAKVIFFFPLLTILWLPGDDSLRAKSSGWLLGARSKDTLFADLGKCGWGGRGQHGPHCQISPQ